MQRIFTVRFIVEGLSKEHQHKFKKKKKAEEEGESSNSTLGLKSTHSQVMNNLATQH